MKNKYSRILIFLAGLSLIGLFLFPVWKITLEAPQYPGGISMYIWINKISGDSPGTLQNINILNHYIGMQAIHPDSIPELNYFQYIVILMTLLAFLLAAFHKRSLLLIWTIVLVLLSAFALYDFYQWEYDYGHNLSPDAAIKVPGMTYQPPFLGDKTLLNFVAYSYPSLGSVFIGLSMLFGGMAFIFKRKYNIEQ
ncbi:MAG TPA: hypothetical protein PK711_12400 [Bacteroidales bacterium]|nr:hypothetical protein [Bacteroidales bacterium]